MIEVQQLMQQQCRKIIQELSSADDHVGSGHNVCR